MTARSRGLLSAFWGSGEVSGASEGMEGVPGGRGPGAPGAVLTFPCDP